MFGARFEQLSPILARQLGVLRDGDLVLNLTLRIGRALHVLEGANYLADLT